MTNVKNLHYHERRLNHPTTFDIAAIYDARDGLPNYKYTYVAQSRDNPGQIQYLSYTNPTLDALLYPLLFPKGDFGWQPGMLYHRGTAHINILLD